MNELSSEQHFSELETKRQRDVETVIVLFDRAARGEDVASALFEALTVIARCCDEREQNGSIDLDQRHQLSLALVRAHASATQFLPAGYDRSLINAGFAAVSYQIHMWAESMEKTSRRDPDDVLDFHAVARMFRNDLHNTVLREQKDARRQKRTTAPVLGR
jgi:hypothetical protein